MSPTHPFFSQLSLRIRTSTGAHLFPAVVVSTCAACMCHACFILFLGNTFGSIARGCKGVFEYVLVFNFLIFSTKVTFWCQLHGYFHPCRIHVLQHQSCRISLLRNMWKRLATKKLLFRTPFSEAGSSSGLGHEPRVFSAVR